MSSELADDLGYARQAARSLSHTDFGTSDYRENVARLLVAFQSLDRGGAFAVIDQEIKDRIRAGVPEGGGPYDVVRDVRELRDSDRIDLSGSVFNGPVVGKSVSHQNH